MNLSEAQKKYLRGRGHQLKPIVTVGNAGLSESVVAEFNSAIAHHELMKIRIRGGDRSVRDDIISTLCNNHDVSLVQRIGNVALLYKPNPDKQPEHQLRIPSP